MNTLEDLLAELTARAPEPPKIVDVACVRGCGRLVAVPERHAEAACCHPCMYADAVAAAKAEALARALETIPSALRGASFGPITQARVRLSRPDQRRVAVAANDGRWVTLLGPPGAGKSTLAAAIARRVLEASVREESGFVGVREVLWVSSFALARANIKHPLGQGDPPLVRQAKAAKTLIVDDLGQEPKIESSSVDEVLFERTETEGRATWITTGLDRAQVANRYGGGIARRVFDLAEVATLGGSDGR